MGPVTVGAGASREPLPPLREVEVARRISFSVAYLASSRFRRSLSAWRVDDDCSR